MSDTEQTGDFLEPVPDGSKHAAVLALWLWVAVDTRLLSVVQGPVLAHPGARALIGLGEHALPALTGVLEQYPSVQLMVVLHEIASTIRPGFKLSEHEPGVVASTQKAWLMWLRAFLASADAGSFSSDGSVEPGMKYQGLRPYRHKDNPEEKRFSQAWSDENEGANEGGSRLLAHLLDDRHAQGGYPPEPSDRDHVVAATVIQWLGSPVGQGFLRGLGYEKTKKKKEV